MSEEKQENPFPEFDKEHHTVTELPVDAEKVGEGAYQDAGGTIYITEDPKGTE